MAAGKRKVVQLCPTLASCTLEEMTDAAIDGQTQFLQLYVNHNRQVSALQSMCGRASNIMFTWI